MKHRIPAPIPVDLSIGGVVPIVIIIRACAHLTKETKPNASIMQLVKPRSIVTQRPC